MEFFTSLLSGSSSLKDREREAEQVNQVFKDNLDNLQRLLESEESNNILALVDGIYESSYPEEQIFMKTPSRTRLKSKKELVVRLLTALDFRGVPAMSELLIFIRKHGPEGVADSLLTLLELLSPLLEGKEAPKFSTDDVVDAIDFEWHSTSRTGSPLLHVIASATSSPRASTASIGGSPLHTIIPASPYRGALSKFLMLVSRDNELGAKSVLDKNSTASTSPQRSLTMSASSQYTSANQDFCSGELTILETPASPEINQVSTVEKPSSYSLDMFPESRLQRRRRRKSSSLRLLFIEDEIEEFSGEGSVGASSKRNSSSSSWRRKSSEFTKIITNTSETSSPMNPGLAAGDSREGVTIAPDKTFLSSIYTQDRHVNQCSRKGSRRTSPSPTPDELALWREDSVGFSVDLVSSDKSAAQTSVRPMLLLSNSFFPKEVLSNSTRYHCGGWSMEEYDPFCAPRLARDFFKGADCWSPSCLSARPNSEVEDADHGIPLTLHDLEAEVCPSGVDDDALKLHEHNLRLRSQIRDEDDAEAARHAHSSHVHDQDAGHAHSSSDKGVNSSLGTDSVNHRLNENIKLKMPELMREDEKTENVQPVDVHVYNVSLRPCELEEHVKVSDSHFEKLHSELDGAEDCKGGELTVINDIEGGQMRMHDDKMEEKTQEEDSARGLNKEKMQLHDGKMGNIINANTLPKGSSEKVILDNTGQFIMGGPRVEFADCNHMQDHCEAHQANPSDLQFDLEQGMQEGLKADHVVSDTSSALGESTPFVLHTYPVENHVMASSRECEGSMEEASMVCEEANSKLDHDKQYGLECPTMVEVALKAGEVSMPYWEGPDKDHIRHRPPAQILDAGSAVRSTKPGHTDQFTVKLIRDSGTQVVDVSESRTLRDVDDYPAAHCTEVYAGSALPISDYELASHSTKSRSAAQSTDTESAVQFTGSTRTHYVPSTRVADRSESQPFNEDDYIQRRTAHFTEPYAGSFAAVNAINSDHIMRGDFKASLKDKHENVDHLSHVFPPSAHLQYCHPISSSTLRHVDSQQPRLKDSGSDTNVRRSKRKGGYLGKLVRGCLSVSGCTSNR